jgi:hypothetical protein
MLAVAAVALAMLPAPPFLTVEPNRVHLGDQVVIRGREWPVNEFCRTKVRLRLESDQNAVLLGFTPIRDNGRFRRTFTPRRGKIGTGKWRIVARQRCESGEDGSAVFVTRRKPLRILH